MVHASLDLGRRDLLEALCDVGHQIEGVDVRKLPDPRLPDAKDHLDRIALGGIRGVEQDGAVPFFRKLLDLLPVNCGIVHHKDNVEVVDDKEGDQLEHVRLEHLSVDC